MQTCFKVSRGGLNLNTAMIRVQDFGIREFIIEPTFSKKMRYVIILVTFTFLDLKKFLSRDFWPVWMFLRRNTDDLWIQISSKLRWSYVAPKAT